MQRFLSPLAKRYLSGVTGLVGIGGIGVSAWALHGRAHVAPVPTMAPAPLKPPTAPAPEPVRLVGSPEIGEASWYGEEFGGKLTANGETFDPDSLTCAHRTLPLGSFVRVTNLRNHKAVTLRVNDRGPLLEDRILDLSHAAALKLGILGLGKVSIQRVSPKDAAQMKRLEAQTHSGSSVTVSEVASQTTNAQKKS